MFLFDQILILVVAVDLLELMDCVGDDGPNLTDSVWVQSPSITENPLDQGALDELGKSLKVKRASLVSKSIGTCWDHILGTPIKLVRFLAFFSFRQIQPKGDIFT